MNTTAEPANKRQLSWVARIAFLMSILTLVIVVMSFVGFRMEWWGYGRSLIVLRAAGIVGGTAIALSIVGIFMTWPGRSQKGLLLSTIALLVAGPILVTPLYWGYSKSALPPIQDISTDLETPPDFWEVPTSRVYPGPEVARQQQLAYPEIKPIIFSRPMKEVFGHAVTLVEERGWNLVASELEEGRIEATVTTFWYGFKDDVVIRLMEVDTGVRVDMRSTSRFGSGGDGGTNANRIRKFLSSLQEQVE